MVVSERLCDATIEDGRDRLRNCQLLDGHAGRHYSALHHGHDVMYWTDEAFTAKPPSSTPPVPTVRSTRHTVSLLPECDINYRRHAVNVEFRGIGADGAELWIVENMGAQLHPDGSWRDHDYYAWRDEQEALAAAKAGVHTLRVNTLTTAEWQARWEAGRGE